MKAEACHELYEELETPEMEKRIYRTDKATKDVNHVKQMKDATGALLNY